MIDDYQPTDKDWEEYLEWRQEREAEQDEQAARSFNNDKDYS